MDMNPYLLWFNMFDLEFLISFFAKSRKAECLLCLYQSKRKHKSNRFTNKSLLYPSQHASRERPRQSIEELSKTLDYICLGKKEGLHAKYKHFLIAFCGSTP